MGISDISLTAGMRLNLQSLNDTSAKIDRTQERLATGRRINSALDGPTNYFAAMQLKNFAEDISETHSAINESIQNIKAASNGISGVSQLLESMKGIVDAAASTSDPVSKDRFAKNYDELYAQLNSLVSDSSYRGTNLIGDSDPRLLRWKADDLPVSLNPGGSSEYTIEGSFLGSGYALYEAGTPDIGWVPNDDGTKIAPVTIDVTSFPEDPKTKLDFVFIIDTTGSMGGRLADVKANVVSFINSLEADNVDGHYAFAAYGDINPPPVGSGDATATNTPTFFSDSASFSAALAPVGLTGGGDFPESGLEGIRTAMADLSFRPDATKRMLLLTDATVHTTADGYSSETVANTAASLSAAGIQLDIAVPVGGFAQTQLTPLAAATGGTVHNLNDPAFYTGGFGVSAPPSTTVPTKDVTVQTADYENGVFSLLFKNPPPGTTKTMTAEKAGLGLYHSWVYDGFQSADGIAAAAKDIEDALGKIRSQSTRFGSGSDILTTRDTFATQTANIALEGAEKLTAADMNEEGANMLILQTRQQLGVTSLSLASQAAQTVLKMIGS